MASALVKETFLRDPSGKKSALKATVMGMLDYLKIAKEYSLKKWNFDIVKDAGILDGWHYFSCTRIGRPRWSSLPCAIRISKDGHIEELEDFESRRKVS